MQIYNPISPVKTMVKIYPHLAFPVDIGVVEDKIVPYLTKEQESFTIWMKSLVFHSKGCTVFDSKGNLIYRVDNYNSKSCSNEVYFMDSYGKILFTLRQKKSGFFKSWEGYNSTGTRFRLSKIFKILPRDSSYKVVMGSRIVDGGDQQSCYKIVNRGSVFAIKDGSGRLMAEVKNKLSDISGLDLGEDVLTMMVEPQLDHSIIMGIVIAYSLTKCKL
ncbi:Tubby-like C-terminal [Arabidopsis suecica]|uniref:Tubby-like C-terminal n=1 Tax=Arabidopsis suecica TaxID=45249 RepID=A0A8T2D0M2_ARASU|nr:Tubby-like C-terminal [Arabidopsis suecica]